MKSSATARTSRNGVAALLLALLLVGAVASAWPARAGAGKPTIVPQVVAIPASSPRLSSPVHHVFGRAPVFLLVDLRTHQTRWMNNRLANAKHSVGLDIADLLLAEQVGTVFAQSIGPGTYERLEAHGVRVLGGHAPTVGDAMRELYRGQTTTLGRPNASIHQGLNGAPVPQAPVPQAPVPQAPMPRAPMPQAPMPQAPPSIAPSIRVGAASPHAYRGPCNSCHLITW